MEALSKEAMSEQWKALGESFGQWSTVDASPVLDRCQRRAHIFLLHHERRSSPLVIVDIVRRRVCPH
jgi:hypothetical protein